LNPKPQESAPIPGFGPVKRPLLVKDPAKKREIFSHCISIFPRGFRKTEKKKKRGGKKNNIHQLIPCQRRGETISNSTEQGGKGKKARVNFCDEQYKPRNGHDGGASKEWSYAAEGKKGKMKKRQRGRRNKATWRCITNSAA